MKLKIQIDLEREDGDHSAVLTQTIATDQARDVIGLLAIAADIAGKMGTEVVRLVYHDCKGREPSIHDPDDTIVVMRLPDDMQN